MRVAYRGKAARQRGDKVEKFLLMFFIMFAGGRIASLGVNQIREIRAEVKQ